MMKKYQNETATRHRRYSATVSNLKASKINTPLFLPIHRACRRSAAASVVIVDPSGLLSSPPAYVVVSNPLDASRIPRPLLTPMLLLLSTWARLNLPPPPLSLL